MIGLINDVEVNAYVKLSVKRSDSGQIVTELKASIVSATLRQLVWKYLCVCMVNNCSVYIHPTVCMCMALTRLVAFSAQLGQWKAAPSVLS